MTPVEIGAFISAGALASTKLLTVAKPLWNKLPRWLSVALPVLVASLPTIASSAGVVKSPVDLVNLGVMSLGLLVPGLVEAEHPSDHK
jgi:hypothetical protein